MSEKIDYEKIGLKCGLEIHQQLDSKKLFCNCPSVLRKDEPDFLINRNLHAVAGESGKIDVAAKYQMSFKKEFSYEGYYDTTCLVELDESPPLEINKDALKIAIHISLLLNCKIIPLTQIMRKSVIDGSNTSGFQRSVLIAEGGEIQTEKGKVGINYVYLEEDAARKISGDDKKTIYRLDRLGIPLVEVVTAPDIKTPEQAKEVALHIGKILRMCKVKRGIGTIRQDINVSVIGHPRAEIKGFQDPKIFVKVVEKEVERQIENIKKGDKNLFPEVRGANLDSTTRYLRPLPGSARMYPETDLPLLKISLEMINSAKKTLPNLKDEMKEFEKIGLNKEMIKLIINEPEKLEEFKSLLNILNNPLIVAKSLLIYQDEIANRYGKNSEEIQLISEKINNYLEQILDAVKKKKINENQIKVIMEEIARGKNLQEALEIEKIELNIIEEKIMNMINEKPGLSENAYIGLIMKDFKGKISGKEASEFIKKYVK